MVGTIVARAGFTDPVSIMFRLADDDSNRTKVIQVRNAKDTVIQQITFTAGGHTGWHSHPGPALVLVTQGELTLYSADDPTCTGRSYSAGQAFIDPGQGHVHIGRASQTENTVVWVTYFDVPQEVVFESRLRIQEPASFNKLRFGRSLTTTEEAPAA